MQCLSVLYWYIPSVLSNLCLGEDQAVDGLATAIAILPSITPVLCLYCTLHRTNHCLKLHPAARSFPKLVAIHVITLRSSSSRYYVDVSDDSQEGVSHPGPWGWGDWDSDQVIRRRSLEMRVSLWGATPKATAAGWPAWSVSGKENKMKGETTSGNERICKLHTYHS